MGRPQCGQMSTSVGIERSQAVHFGLVTESSFTRSLHEHKDKRNMSDDQDNDDQSSAHEQPPSFPIVQEWQRYQVSKGDQTSERNVLLCVGISPFGRIRQVGGGHSQSRQTLLRGRIDAHIQLIDIYHLL